ncbi:hypothetical protein ES703_89642 [subsurface metagenome]
MIPGVLLKMGDTDIGISFSGVRIELQDLFEGLPRTCIVFIVQFADSFSHQVIDLLDPFTLFGARVFRYFLFLRLNRSLAFLDGAPQFP